ncbi:hypothetical protein BpHYR1_051379 [Brachionus plicatilis]|uniref:Uncharacterized protein n=1 Tax=Brachionus plicatilis TaxID=10195 RepID=A0A3M7PS90_BRAPC|nr:hypothetical protein BpHYR1_051379 [Brachionus plicatilis]
MRPVCIKYEKKNTFVDCKKKIKSRNRSLVWQRNQINKINTIKRSFICQRNQIDEINKIKALLMVKNFNRFDTTNMSKFAQILLDMTLQNKKPHNNNEKQKRGKKKQNSEDTISKNRAKDGKIRSIGLFLASHIAHKPRVYSNNRNSRLQVTRS